MDSEIHSTATINANQIDEILSVSSGKETAERAADDDATGSSENELNIPISYSLISSSKECRNQEPSNNSHETPTIDNSNACQSSQQTYNEYVNQVYLNGKEHYDEEEEGEVKPLIKSIVKSPSGNLRPSLLNGSIKSKNKRLSWQATATDCVRNHPEKDTNGGNTQSTSLDSSEEQAITQLNEDCPSSPIISSSSSSSSSSDDDEFSEIVFQAPDGGVR
jgi:hypothetical protein